MWNDIDGIRVDAVDAGQQFGRRLRHDHDRGAGADQAGKHASLTRGWVPRHGVERRDDRLGQRGGKVQNRLTVGAAPDAVLVLDGHDSRIGAVQVPGHTEIVAPNVAADAVLNLYRVDVRPVGRMERNDLVLTRGTGKVPGEGGYPTSSGGIGRNEDVARTHFA